MGSGYVERMRLYRLSLDLFGGRTELGRPTEIATPLTSAGRMTPENLQTSSEN